VRLRANVLLLLLAVLAATLGSCGQAAGTFAPDGACVADGRAAAAYPDLEALVPRDIGGKATTVDSGRNCSDKALGTLVAHDIREVRYAGATLDEGGGDGTVVAIFEAGPGQPSLTAEEIAEFYTSGAVGSSKTGNTITTRPTMGDAGVVFRLDTLNDLSQQTVVVLPGETQVRVVIVATSVGPDASKAAHDARVEAAVAAAAGIPAPQG
jgi:hypothetical protein